MTKKPALQPQDKYVLRLPDGLRDRIKAYAERQGTSMNHEIVRILEIEFPEQWPVEDKLTELGEMLSILTAGRKDARFAQFSEKLEETITGIISGRVTSVDPEARRAVASMWDDFKLRESEDGMENAHDHLRGRTEEEIANYEITGKFEKYANALPTPRDPGSPHSNFLTLVDYLPREELAKLAEMIAAADTDGAAQVIRGLDKAEIEKRIAFHKLPIEEQYRLSGEESPSESTDPFKQEG